MNMNISFVTIILALQPLPSTSFVPSQPPTTSTSLFSTNNPNDDPLKIAIIGAGPSSLLLAHRLLSSPSLACNIDIYESRSDPRSSDLQDRAYALGLGARGRTAIQSVSEGLWSAVKDRGFECDRFRLHLNPSLSAKLRDKEEGVQPSVLIYQSDLCGALLDELDERAGNKANVCFDANVDRVDLSSSRISIDNRAIDTTYDLIVGCDGANSIVRKSLEEHSHPFAAATRKLPGYFKVARVDGMPPKMDPGSVALLLPRKGRVTAFVEPTVGGGACILFAGRIKENSTSEEEIDLGTALFGTSSTNATHLQQMILNAFPLLEDTPSLSQAAESLLSQRNGIASSVKCNIYHSSSDLTPAVLCGDAAHATGGVSGQGCNSALMDSKVLADCLENYSTLSGTDGAKKLRECLRQYSLRQVPEGWALYDLSFGNDGKTLPILRNVASVLSNVLDGVFGGKFGIGKKPLQTLLASSDRPFVEIRRERERHFIEEFMSDEVLRERLDGVYE